MTSKTAAIISITLCAFGLSACNSLYNKPSYNTQTAHSKNRDAAIQLYPDGYDNGGAYAPDQPNAKTVTVPDSYHVGELAAPASFKDRDNSWVNKQNPQGYTIEIAHGDKANDVASTLQKAPKNERAAEVKYKQDGKQLYKGVYGSYPTYEAAQQALNALPEDVKQGASVKTWGNIQSAGE
jgi:septal ring-binding cell division protein DamX